MSKRYVKGRWESLLPDEIAVDILSRLHPKDVLRCRCVVKKWRGLTSTPFFMDLHKQGGIAHMILVDVPKRIMGYRDQFFLDEWWITARKKPAILKISSHPLCYSDSSHDGLLVLTSNCRCGHKIVIVNPFLREKVTIMSMVWHSRIDWVYGVYFNPTLKEYCALFDVTTFSTTIEQPVPLGSSTDKPSRITYKVLTLGPKPCLRDLRNPYKQRYRSRSSDFVRTRPAMVDGFIYWMIDVEGEYSYYADIMEFDTKSDEFKLMRYPAPMNDYGKFSLDLLNIDGFLSLVQIVAKQGVVEVNMWTLKDRASESWTFSHYNLDYKVYPPESGWRHFETIAVKNGEILIRSEQRLYVCNLEWGTAKVFGNKIYKHNSKNFSHDISLSSLKDYTPVIRIGNGTKCRDCNRRDKEEASSSNSAIYEPVDVEEITISGLDEGAGSST